MKVRNGFVSNSSSSSFLVIGQYIGIEEISLDLIKKYEVFFLGDFLNDGQDIVQIKTKEQLSLYKHFIKEGDYNFVVSYVPTEKTNNLSINKLKEYIDDELEFSVLNFEADYHSSVKFEDFKYMYIENNTYLIKDGLDVSDYDKFMKFFQREDKLKRINEL